MSSHDDLVGLVFIAILLALLVVGGYFIYEEAVLTPQKIDEAKLKISELGLPIEKVTVNSPTIWVEIENYQSFVDLVKQGDYGTIYFDGTSFMVFNAELTIGHRIYYREVV